MDNQLQNKLNRIAANIKELKSNQVFGGDSWEVYRFSSDFSRAYTRCYRIDFYPDIEGPFVAKAYLTSPDRITYGSDRDLRPDPNYSGRWYTVWNTAAGSTPQPWTVFIYSTRKGRVVITDITPTI